MGCPRLSDIACSFLKKIVIKPIDGSLDRRIMRASPAGTSRCLQGRIGRAKVASK